MGCEGLPLILAPEVTSVSIIVGAGGTGNGASGGDTLFGDLLRLRGGKAGTGAKHYGLSSTPEGFRNGFMISGGDGGSASGVSTGRDCVDTGYTGGSHADGGGGASAFGDGGSTSVAPGPGAGGHGDTTTSQDGGDGFLRVSWWEQMA